MMIQLGSIAFLDFATSGWVYSDLIDWFGATDDKVPNDERPSGIGSFDVDEVLRASKAISFEAIYLGSSSAEVEDAADQIAAVGSRGPVLMTVATDRGASWRWVSVRASSVEDNHQASEIKVSVDCLARDPRRYADAGWASTAPATTGSGRVWPAVWPKVWPGTGAVAGRFGLNNYGRAPSSPSFRINGPVPSSALFTAIDTGARIGFGRSIPSGSQVVIDTATKTALLDGSADVSRWLQYREWEDIAELSSKTYQFENSGGTGTGEGRVLPAWW